jgi:hypothetical protein
MKHIKLFENFTESKSMNIQSLRDFANKPLFGKYILDANLLGNFKVLVDLSDQPDQQGKSALSQKSLTIDYYPKDNEWNLSEIVGAHIIAGHWDVKPEDQKMLDDMANALKKDNPSL